MLTLLAACGGDPGPEQVVREVYGGLRSNPLPETLKAVYQRLDSKTREALVAHAARVGDELGVADIEPWEVLTYRGLASGDRILSVDAEEAGDNEATVAIEFAAYMVDAEGNPCVPTSAEPCKTGRAVVRVVREEDGWRVQLPLPGVP